MSMDTPKTREELVEDLRSVLQDAGEESATVQYLLKPENLARISDDNLKEIIDRYAAHALERENTKSGIDGFDEKAKSIAEEEGVRFRDEAAGELDAYFARLEKKDEEEGGDASSNL